MLLVIVILIVVVMLWQWDNINALFMGITSSEEELSVKREENDKIISSTLENYPEISVRDLTDEEKEALAEGMITKEESLLLIQGKVTLEELLEKAEETAPVETPPEEILPVIPPENIPPITPPEDIPPEEVPKEEEPVPPTLSADEEIANLVGEMYILKSEFTSALKNLESTSLKAYSELPDQEKKLQKPEMMKKILDEVSVMEKDCDTQVKAILDRLTVLLEESGKDLTLVESIKTAYNNEKTITKAEYINTYFK